MILLRDKSKNLIGKIDSFLEAFVIEERNGVFEFEGIMLNNDTLFSSIKEGNIIDCNANYTLLEQKFRIYMTRKLMSNRVEVYARHISFDLAYDYIDSFSCTNQSAEYVLNQLFRMSNFSSHYMGYSDIVNAQNYSINEANILEAIGGKRGSVIDTFGTGAEILRDNENISVLNRRGNDNLVTIEYRKNLTGFELEEDTTDLITRIKPFARYTDETTNEEITVKADYVDSPLIGNYAHPFIKSIDYSDKFEDGEVPTAEKLIALAEKEYQNNKVDIPKQNFKIDFIPLSKVVGYEALSDNISLCDTVTIIDTRYNINTKAKVIKTVFNVLKNRYESIELGEPKTSLGDIIGSGNNEPVVGPQGPPGPPGVDGNIGDFPNSLPQVPILETFVYGFSNIELRWTFENKVYYSYELYASKEVDFIPNSFNKIFEGQASSYMFQALPNETWYFKVCGVNTYGERTEFSNQVTVTTTKIDDLSNYVDNMAIGEALIGELNLGRGWVGQLNANLLDVKGNFSVTDGSGKRTLDIDSFGNVHINSPNINLTGTTTFGSSGNYLQIDDWVYNAYVNNKKCISIGAYQENGMSVPHILMSNENVGNADTNVFVNKAYANNHHLAYKNDNGQWSSIIFEDDGDIHINPINSLNVNRPIDLTGDLLIRNSNKLRIYDTVGALRSELNYVGLYANQLATMSGNTIHVNNILRSMKSGNSIGTSDGRWSKLYAVSSADISSDIRLKENIRYINSKTRQVDLNTITQNDMYNFVKDDLHIAEYNYLNESNSTFGFIAQDIKDTRVGSRIIREDNTENKYLSYDSGGYENVIAGALKEAIQEIEKLKIEIQNLKAGI